MKPQPIAFVWAEVALPDGAGELVLAMVPLPRYANVAKRQFGEAGSEHVLEAISERSMASHSQFFAAVNDAFNNLPENVSARWPTAQHFRKWCLIECGYFEEKEIVCLSEQRAAETALFVRDLDEYARIHVHGHTVLVRRAKSQSRGKMQKDEFEASKKAVLDLAEQFVGVSRSQMMKHAGRSA